MQCPRFVLAGTNSGVGKTTITLGLLNSFHRKGLHVQPFKSGPDYIDPAFHTFVTENTSRNLDAWLLSEESIRQLMVKSGEGKDISIVEGVMGFYDGHTVYRDKGSTAHLSKIIKAPVVLILNGSGISTSAAAIVHGFKSFDPDVDVSGVIINKVNSERHYEILKEAIEETTGVKCYGYLKKNPEVNLSSRHLGLIPSYEVTKLKEKIDLISDMMEESIDFDGLLALGQGAPDLSADTKALEGDFSGLRIGVPKDKAFNFYYQDNLDLLEKLGAKLICFSPMSDEKVPEALDGLYIGGGFPEVFAKELSENKAMRASIKDFIESERPVYAECGGLMYMCRQIVDLEGNAFPMVGVLNNESVMTGRLQHFGYVDITLEADAPIGSKGMTFRAHEFHRSKVLEMTEDATCYHVEKDKGNGEIKSWQCGYRYKNFLGGYAHVHFYNNLEIPVHFLEKCQGVKERNNG
ncbi:MAG: cobyrinate a,c-diamide synthase [Clostridia bacterium]|nr:cobyrinate a,c-diamide synthase [Clostridia bacterium]